MKRTSLYLNSDEELEALKNLSAALEIHGQRGAGHNPLAQEVAQWFLASPETTTYHFRQAQIDARGAMVAEND